MTTTATAPPAPAAPARPPRRPRTRWRQRWHRMVIPFAVLGLLAGVTLLARYLEEPRLSDSATLEPTSTSQDGSSALAQLLTERGVTIDHVRDLDEGRAALERGGDAVVFVPKPTVFGAVLAWFATREYADHRVVLVAPGAVELAVTGLPVTPGRDRWAAQDNPPGCTVPEAVAAGRATALRNRYAVSDPDDVCYRGGLVRTQAGNAEVFVVGATDPFRNRRIDEHGNAQLAVELLAARDRVIWADALPFDPDFDLDPELPEIDRPERSERDRAQNSGLEYLFEGYPAWVLVGLSLAGALAVLVALARARRLGPLVSEPLPVLVPAAEAVAGRGRLYQHTTGGRGTVLTALRESAIRRIVRGLGLPPAPPPETETVVNAAARRTGLPADHVRHTLYGPPPESDTDLSNAVAALDALVEAVTRDNPRTPEE